MPPSLLYLLLDAVGGSYTAMDVDLARFDPVADAMEVIQYADPFRLQIRFVDPEMRTEPTQPKPYVNLQAQSVQIDMTQPAKENLDPSLLPAVPTPGWRLSTPDGTFFYWNALIMTVEYTGWWATSMKPFDKSQIPLLRYTPDGRKIG